MDSLRIAEYSLWLLIKAAALSAAVPAALVLRCGPGGGNPARRGGQAAADHQADQMGSLGAPCRSRLLLPHRFRCSDAARLALRVGSPPDNGHRSAVIEGRLRGCVSAGQSPGSRASSVPLTSVIRRYSRSPGEPQNRSSDRIYWVNGQIPKLTVRVRFPSTAPKDEGPGQGWFPALGLRAFGGRWRVTGPLAGH